MGLDIEFGGCGVLNYFGVFVIFFDGISVWIFLKKDNIWCGMGCDGLLLNFEYIVCVISFKVLLVIGIEFFGVCIDYDNVSLVCVVMFGLYGVFFFVVFEMSWEVVVVDVYFNQEFFWIVMVCVLQGFVVVFDGLMFVVYFFMDCCVEFYDIVVFVVEGCCIIMVVGGYGVVGVERFVLQILQGKCFFYDVCDLCFLVDCYMSCVICYLDGGLDGCSWDFMQFGEGVCNMIFLNG